jgi:hypothetical protein
MQRVPLCCGLKRFVQLELLPEGFAVVHEDDMVRGFRDRDTFRATQSALGRTGRASNDTLEKVQLLGFKTGQRIAYEALASYVKSIIYDGGNMGADVELPDLTSFADDMLSRVVLEVKPAGRMDPSASGVCVPARIRKHNDTEPPEKFITEIVPSCEMLATLYRHML